MIKDYKNRGERMSNGSFKRDMYYKIEKSIENVNVVFLLGPRKCGKTYALGQIKDAYNNAKYYDFKQMSEDKSMDAVNSIVSDIFSGQDIIYLLDEVTYMFFPEEEIAKIAESYTKAKQQGIEIKTKIVFTGSQSVALEAWGRRAFCNHAIFLNESFLSYSEWLRYKEREDITPESYLDFIQGTSDFYNFTTVEDYLKGCLDETVISNSNARNYIYGNDCELVDTDTLVDILYLCLFTLHDTSSAQSFFKSRSVSDKIAYLSGQMIKDNPLTTIQVREMVAKSFVNRYDNIQATDIDTLKQSFSFLIRCGLISATPIFTSFNHENINVLKQLENQDGIYKKKSDLLGHTNFTINYPMFFVEIMKDIFGNHLPHNLNNMLIGSIVECNVRGLLPNNSCFEYRDEQGREIDYINRRCRTAIEITIANKILRNVHFDLISSEDRYKKILLSRDKKEKNGDIEIIPYSEFIYNISKGDSKDKLLQIENKGVSEEESLESIERV